MYEVGVAPWVGPAHHYHVDVEACWQQTRENGGSRAEASGAAISCSRERASEQMP